MALIKKMTFNYEKDFDSYFLSIIISSQSFLFQIGISIVTL